MLSLIFAASKNNCIGNNGKLPWHLPEDMKRFRQLTMGKTVLMGRKTWESLPIKFRPLPGRNNVVVTRQANYTVPAGVHLHSSIESALAHHTDEDIVVIGGAEIYNQTINRADTLYVTHVDQIVEGDAFCPSIDPKQWKETERENHDGFSFVTYKRA